MTEGRATCALRGGTTLRESERERGGTRYLQGRVNRRIQSREGRCVYAGEWGRV